VVVAAAVAAEQLEPRVAVARQPERSRNSDTRSRTAEPRNHTSDRGN